MWAKFHHSLSESTDISVKKTDVDHMDTLRVIRINSLPTVPVRPVDR